MQTNTNNKSIDSLYAFNTKYQIIINLEKFDYQKISDD